MITIICACSENRVIGKDNKLPWHIPSDLKRFKKLTLGNVVVMGRNTYQSMGKALANRTNVVLSKNGLFNPDDAVVFDSVELVLEEYADENVFVIGGEQIYKEFLPYADRIELTFIEKEFEGDAFFPELGEEWKVINTEIVNGTDFTYSFISYEKNTTNDLVLPN